MALHESRERLEGWAREAAASVGSDAALHGGIPGDCPPGAIGLYLMAIAPCQELTAARRPEPFRFELRYLVTVAPDAADAAARDALFEALLVGAATRSGFDLDLEPLPPEIWAALGAPPQPSFVVVVETAVPRPAEAASLVLYPLEVDLQLAGTLQGLVVGPGGVPLAGARVEAPGLNVAATADASGRFALASVPADQEAPTRLRVLVGDREFSGEVGRRSAGEPVVIRCELLEE